LWGSSLLPVFSKKEFTVAHSVLNPKTKEPSVGVKPQFGISMTPCEAVLVPETLSLEEIRVDMADARVESGPVTLVTNVGSCVAICLHDPINKCGGLAHIMLPTPNNPREPLPYKYAETAVPALANSVRKMHALDSRLIAKISGGANMFPTLKCGALNIGEKNVQAVKEALLENNIRLLAEDVGGTCGRRIVFNVHTGLTIVRTLNGGVKKL
jgi:chemotaxis protein CheD